MIDSINFSVDHLEEILNDESFVIETVKNISFNEQHRWLSTFGKHLNKGIIEAQILHTEVGLTLPIKRYIVSKKKQTIEFAGLQGYNEHSKFLFELLDELREKLLDSRVTRIDIAIDFEHKIPNRVIKALCSDREPFKFKNTTYYKAKKEGKENPRLNIKKYDKALKEGLDYPLERLEFVFKGGYFKELCFKDIEKVFKKMEKTIKRFSTVDVKIETI